MRWNLCPDKLPEAWIHIPGAVLDVLYLSALDDLVHGRLDTEPA